MSSKAACGAKNRQGNTRPTAAKRVTKPGQKHQNTVAWKTDRYHKDGKIAVVKNTQVVNCCPRCTDQIQWKIKYGKYKPLTAPSKCVDCLQKVVKHAYHIRCGDCVKKSGKCAKCGSDSEEWVATPGPTPQEIAREEQEQQMELKALPERRRRTFLRQLERGDTEMGEEAAAKLAEMKQKYGKDGGGFDLDDLDEDFDDLGIGSDEEGDESEGSYGDDEE